MEDKGDLIASSRTLVDIPVGKLKCVMSWAVQVQSSVPSTHHVGLFRAKETAI